MRTWPGPAFPFLSVHEDSLLEATFTQGAAVGKRATTGSERGVAAAPGASKRASETRSEAMIN